MKTMTVGGVITKLREYPPDTPVYAEREGVFAYITDEDFYIKDKNDNYLGGALVIYVDHY